MESDTQTLPPKRRKMGRPRKPEPGAPTPQSAPIEALPPVARMLPLAEITPDAQVVPLPHSKTPGALDVPKGTSTLALVPDICQAALM